MIALSRDAHDAKPSVRIRPQGRQRDEDGPVDAVRIERLNFDYRMRGDAAFRPSQAFDDGRFTYIQLPAALQETPAVFVAGESGEGQLVNYMTRGRFLIVQRLADRFLLRLGSSQVEVERRQPLDASGRLRAFPVENLSEPSP
jgi:type IV secretion system protein VirB9